MTDQEFRKSLLKVAVDMVHAELKPRGFKKKGNRFDRVRGELLDIVWIQTDRQPTPGELGFRINPEMIPLPLFEKWIEFLNMPRQSPGPGHGVCDLGLMRFTEARRDRWHEVSNPEDVRRLVTEDLETLREHVLPIMEGFPDTEAYVQAMRDGRDYAWTRFYAARMIALWDGKPQPNIEDFRRPVVPPVEELLKDKDFAAAVEKVAKKKRDFYSKRKKG